MPVSVHIAVQQAAAAGTSPAGTERAKKTAAKVVAAAGTDISDIGSTNAKMLPLLQVMRKVLLQILYKLCLPGLIALSHQ